MSGPTAQVAVDLGKTTCRVREVHDGRTVAEATGPGAPGLADPTGLTAAAAAIDETWRRLGGTHPVSRVVVGAAGAAADGVAAGALASRLRDLWPEADLAVASDALVGHAGALGGGVGVALTIGTGAVAIGVDEAGQVHRVDGWGPLLGDLGGGGWIGLEALRHALRAHDGRGPDSALVAAARERYGDLDRLPARLPEGPGRSAGVAAFVPDVLACAEAGDAAARAVLERAATLLAETTTAACRRTGSWRVVALGGLADALGPAWRAALPAEAEPVPAAGSALDGATLLLDRDDLPHARHLVRPADPSRTNQKERA